MTIYFLGSVTCRLSVKIDPIYILRLQSNISQIGMELERIEYE